MNITINYHPLSGPMSDGMKKINGLHDQHTADGAGGPPPLPEKLPPEIPSGISVRESAVAGVPCLADHLPGLIGHLILQRKYRRFINVLHSAYLK